MAQNLKTERKKTLSLQDKIDIYLQMIPKPQQVRKKLIQFQDFNPTVFKQLSAKTTKNTSMLKRVDKIIQSSSEVLLKNYQLLKSNRNLSSLKALNPLSPALIKNQECSRAYINSIPKYKKVPSQPVESKIGKPILVDIKTGFNVKNTPISRLGILSPSICIKTKGLKHKRQKSSIDFSTISLSGWNAE